LQNGAEGEGLMSKSRAGLMYFLLISVSMLAEANGRMPCDRGAGGIAYCIGDKFVCNDGRISGSKKICDSSIHGNGEKKKTKN
jgi:hypothetical protein